MFYVGDPHDKYAGMLLEMQLSVCLTLGANISETHSAPLHAEQII